MATVAPPRHPIACHGCSSFPIVGPRLQSTTTPSIDYCKPCAAKSATAHGPFALHAAPPVHRVSCSGCKAATIVGPRAVSKAVKGFNLCVHCVRTRAHDETHGPFIVLHGAAAHRGAVCGGCKASPIVGPRFTSSKDASLDLCASCAISGRWNVSHGPFTVLIKPPAVHPGSTCAGCKTAPVVGPRFQSTKHPALSFCKSCTDSGRYTAEHGSFFAWALPAAHPGVACSNCKAALIVGTRYKAKATPNADLCSTCYVKGGYGGAYQSIETPVVHRGFACDACHAPSIVGVRYRSTTTPNYNLCRDCVQNDATHGPFQIAPAPLVAKKTTASKPAPALAKPAETPTKTSETPAPGTSKPPTTKAEAPTKKVEAPAKSVTVKTTVTKTEALGKSNASATSKPTATPKKQPTVRAKPVSTTAASTSQFAAHVEAVRDVCNDVLYLHDVAAELVAAASTVVNGRDDQAKAPVRPNPVATKPARAANKPTPTKPQPAPPAATTAKPKTTTAKPTATTAKPTATTAPAARRTQATTASTIGRANDGVARNQSHSANMVVVEHSIYVESAIYDNDHYDLQLYLTENNELEYDGQYDVYEHQYDVELDDLHGTHVTLEMHGNNHEHFDYDCYDNDHPAYTDDDGCGDDHPEYLDNDLYDHPEHLDNDDYGNDHVQYTDDDCYDNDHPECTEYNGCGDDAAYFEVGIDDDYDHGCDAGCGDDHVEYCEETQYDDDEADDNDQADDDDEADDDDDHCDEEDEEAHDDDDDGSENGEDDDDDEEHEVDHDNYGDDEDEHDGCNDEDDSGAEEYTGHGHSDDDDDEDSDDHHGYNGQSDDDEE